MGLCCWCGVAVGLAVDGYKGLKLAPHGNLPTPPRLGERCKATYKRIDKAKVAGKRQINICDWEAGVLPSFPFFIPLVRSFVPVIR